MCRVVFIRLDERLVTLATVHVCRLQACDFYVECRASENGNLLIISKHPTLRLILSESSFIMDYEEQER
jgi:hypothetical protein